MRPITITLTSRTTELTGSLVDEANRPAAAITVIVFSRDRTYWQPQSRRIQVTRPGNDGQFSLKNLPAGEYLLVAVTEVDEGQWFDPKFLASIAAAGIGVRITDGQRTVQNLRVGR